MNAFTFRVEGMEPAPQGSKRHIGNGRMVEQSTRLKPWRLLVTYAALGTGVEMINAPVRISIVFLFLRPKGHFNKKGVLKESAPKYHCTSPDVDKLQRSTFDALTGSILRDDRLIVGCNAEKRYCIGDERPGAIITTILL